MTKGMLHVCGFYTRNIPFPVLKICLQLFSFYGKINKI